MSDGLRKVSKLGVADGAPIEAHHVSHIVDTLNGEAICDVKFCGSLTIDGSTYNSDTVYSNNFQASTALTVKGSTSNQLIFLDKNGSNNIRFRDAGGTVNRGYIGFSGDDLIINNQQGNGNISIYNINEALTIDTSQNVTIPNGMLSVKNTGVTTQIELLKDGSSRLEWRDAGDTSTRGYIGYAVAGVDSFILYNGENKPFKIYNNGTKSLEIDSSHNITFTGTISGDGSGLTNLNLSGVDGSGLTNVSSGGPTFGLNSQIPFVNNDTNDYDYDSKLTYNNITLFSNSTAANSPGIQVNKINTTNNTKIFGGSLSGVLDGVNWAIDRAGVTGLVLKTTTNKSLIFATNNSTSEGVLQLRTNGNVDIGQAYNDTTLGARVGIVGVGSTENTTNLLLKNSLNAELFRVKDNGEISGGTFSGNFVGDGSGLTNLPSSTWDGTRVGNSSITGQLNVISDDDRPVKITDSNSSSNKTCYISFQDDATPTSAERAIIGFDSDDNIRINQVGNGAGVSWHGLKILREDSNVLIDKGLKTTSSGRGKIKLESDGANTLINADYDYVDYTNNDYEQFFWLRDEQNFAQDGEGVNYSTYHKHSLRVDGDILLGTFNNTAKTSLGVDTDGRILEGSSDRRLKKDITQVTGSLNKLLQFDTYKFKYIEEMKMGDDYHFGHMAQEVQEVFPELVSPRSGDEEHLSLNYMEMIPLLVQSIKEQQDMIDGLKDEINDLKNK